MTTFRKIILANKCFYHLYNRSIERKPVFFDKKSYERAMTTLQFYRHANLPLKLSKFLVQPEDKRNIILSQIDTQTNKLVDIITFCFMPNHFHFLLEQKQSNGISIFLSNFTNSYTKYFNTRAERSGPIFEGIFKAKLVETDEQLIHLSRYIHINPTSSFLIKIEKLEHYPWSSLPDYLNDIPESICNKQRVLGFFPSLDDYKKFLYDQISYAQDLEKIKHLIIE